MDMFRLFMGGLAAAAALGSAEAVVTYTFTDSPNGVRLSYSGNINTTGLASQGALSDLSRYIDIEGASPPPGHQMYEFQNMQYSSLYPGLPATSFRYSATGITFDWRMTITAAKYVATASDGQTFGFYIFARDGGYITWMNLPAGYTSGQPISGSQTFGGQTLVSMGLTADETFQVFLPGNEKIVGIVAIPESETLLVSGVAGLVLLGVRRRSHGVEENPPAILPPLTESGGSRQWTVNRSNFVVLPPVAFVPVP